MFFDRALRDSWAFYSLNFVTFELIILPIAFPAELLKTRLVQSLGGGEDQFLLHLLTTGISILAYGLVITALILHIDAMIRRRQYSVPALWRMAMQRIAPMSVLIIFEGAIVAIGLLLFIVPGILLLCRLAFARYDLVLNGTTPAEAIRNSWTLTGRAFWLLVCGFLVMVVVASLLQWFFNQLQTVMDWHAWWFDAFISSLFVVVWSYFLVYSFYFFAIATVGGRTESGPARLEQPDTRLFKEMDVVQAGRALQGEQAFIPAGTFGVIIAIYWSANRYPLYEVEFVRDDDTLGILTVRGGDLELVEQAETQSDQEDQAGESLIG